MLGRVGCSKRAQLGVLTGVDGSFCRYKQKSHYPGNERGTHPFEGSLESGNPSFGYPWSPGGAPGDLLNRWLSWIRCGNSPTTRVWLNIAGFHQLQLASYFIISQCHQELNSSAIYAGLRILQKKDLQRFTCRGLSPIARCWGVQAGLWKDLETSSGCQPVPYIIH